MPQRLRRSALAAMTVVAMFIDCADAAAAVRAVRNPIPPRLQWYANNGYCGEVGFISAGLRYGQYLSQYDARALASDGLPQSDPSAQLLLGVNDAHAAKQMRLAYIRWNPTSTSSTHDFLAWVKDEVVKGYPVIIGVYTNEHRFYGSSDPGAGDPDYDHIVIATGVRSKHPLTPHAPYYPGDLLTFSDNGLWTGAANDEPKYAFTYTFNSFPATRRQANAPGGAVYSLPAHRDYAIAVTGVADRSHETLPIRLTTSVNYESPPIEDGSSARPASMPLTLAVTVSGLQTGRRYNLYRYDSFARVPTRDFNANASAATEVQGFTATGPTYQATRSIDSTDEVIYRAVPAATS